MNYYSYTHNIGWDTTASAHVLKACYVIYDTPIDNNNWYYDDTNDIAFSSGFVLVLAEEKLGYSQVKVKHLSH
ncbi:hypothetical protein [Staphylococcus coagulans]|uniref:hypothetical protein n=1 Tax=Staphylococcus coagulans TaxID=74706 RepID=UPI001BE82726|nr:hypothetical protein [Staphylococcus coagulans]MBT2813784.1 hypothetical protein [Staphylococcus coagulans]MBT2816103.1 hypothetical protein [Staphylococcus coagulans]MBT2836564.1 hypothetical protein [Staphylococcus coagulans]MBT2841092.1 hypothetical protein [Staphylococcus coagulans]MBT2848009.1 hypothetical protein [Staphylococcus coagulans]